MLPCLTLTAALSLGDSGEVNKAVECFTGPASHQIWALSFCSFKSKSFSRFFGGFVLVWVRVQCFLILNCHNLWACVYDVWMGCALSRYGDLQSLASNFHTLNTQTHTHTHTPTHTFLYFCLLFPFSNSVTFLVCLFIWAPIHSLCMNNITTRSQCSTDSIWVMTQ